MSNIKGVFCLEGGWSRNLKRPHSVRPILDLLDQYETHAARHIYHDVATLEELWHYLDKWKQKRFDSHSILFLAFHGLQGKIMIGDRRNSKRQIDLTTLEDRLKGACKGRIIHFSSCDTLSLESRNLKRFLKTTGALAVSGYRETVDWNQSAAFELLALAQMQDGASTVPGIRKIRRNIARSACGLEKELGFRMIPRDPIRRS